MDRRCFRNGLQKNELLNASECRKDIGVRDDHYLGAIQRGHFLQQQRAGDGGHCSPSRPNTRGGSARCSDCRCPCGITVAGNKKGWLKNRPFLLVRPACHGNHPEGVEGN